MEVLASVILPVYNVEPYLKEAMDSILNQTFTDFEILALEDASTDRSLKILEGCDDPRLRILPSKRNRGLVYQLNRGIEEARGKYLLRMDADDTCSPDRFALQVEFMEHHPETVLCGTYVKVFGNKYWNWRMPTKHGGLCFSLLFGATFAHNSVILRKETLDKASLRYRAEAFPVEDYDLWLRIVEYGKAAVIGKYLTTYRITGDQVTSREGVQKESRLKEISLDTFSRKFFPVTEKEQLLFEILRGERSLAGIPFSEFTRYLERIRIHPQEWITRKSLTCSLDRTLLMRIIQVRSFGMLCRFLFHKRFLRRIPLVWNALVKKS